MFASCISLAFLTATVTTLVCGAAVPTSPQSWPTAPDGTFDFDNLFPKEPASSVMSLYKATDELAAWNDLSLFSAVSQLLQLLPINSGGLYKAGVIMAPTNFAFLQLVFELYPELAELTHNPAAFLSNSTAVEEFLAPVQTLLTNSSVDDVAKLATALNFIINYHLIGDNLSEPELKAAGSVTTLASLPVDMSAYPKLKSVGGTISTRYARMIETLDANLILIDRVLLPAPATEIRKLLPLPIDILPKLPAVSRRAMRTARQVVPPEHSSTGDVDEPEETPSVDPYYMYTAPYAPPLQDVRSFVAARADLAIFNTAAELTHFWYDRYYGFDSHLAVPNNNAFIALFTAVAPEAGKKVEDLLNSNTPNPDDLMKLVGNITDVIAKISALPSLQDILAYHALAGSASLDARVDGGAQVTLLDNATVSVGKVDGVVVIDDSDPSRGSAQRITTHATLEGYVSVIDSVLAPFDTAIAAVVLLPTDDEPASSPENPDANSLQSDSDDGQCFPANSVVHTADGRTVAMRDLQAGDSVRVHNAHDEVSPVFLFTHRDAEAVAEFVRIETEGGHVLRATAGHYVHTGGKLRAAGSVRIGDVLETVDGDSVVTGVARVVDRGLYAPHSLHGDLIVDGIRVSTYSTAVHPKWAHALLAPVRLVAAVMDVREPLGSVFYQGSERFVGLFPRGQEVY